MRILCHAQHLTGVGHFVRMHRIASGLAVAHEVHLVDGGRPVPVRTAPAEPRRLSLPRLARRDGELVALDESDRVEEVVRRRASILADAAAYIRPDVVLVDHFPFSKWELTEEIEAMIDAAADAVVLCSLRDFAPRTRYESLGGDYGERVIATLAARFHGLLVHADPTFTTLDEHFPAVAQLPVPVRYTGFVAEPATPSQSGDLPYAVLSSGGLQSSDFVAVAISAFRRASDIPLHVFAPEVAGNGALDAEVHGFSPDFDTWLAGATLSISRAGYNTTTSLLRHRVRAVVVPDPGLSDQGPRAARLAQHGLAQVVGDAEAFDVDALADAIRLALGGPRPAHGLDLEGVAATRRLVEDPSWTQTPTPASPATPR